jgi:hypothetical protein
MYLLSQRIECGALDRQLCSAERKGLAVRLLLSFIVIQRRYQARCYGAAYRTVTRAPIGPDYRQRWENAASTVGRHAMVGRRYSR